MKTKRKLLEGGLENDPVISSSYGLWRRCLMGKAWFDRGQYASIIKQVLEAQIKCYQNEQDNLTKTKISQSIGYLGQIVNSLIRAQEEIGLPDISEDKEEITENIIKGFVRHLILKLRKNEISKNVILQEIIEFRKCDMNYANLIFSKMEGLGLRVCIEAYSKYNLVKFAEMRKFLDDEELEKHKKRLRDEKYEHNRMMLD